ncbi:HAD hydrolase-like protein [Spirillospora sp. NPDC047279]|uniref:HAD hydrolase-like protein n=1 Tax=Spirillospora sp. NPDC047279 TaxID=3155478 RepID=UPI0033C649F6
MVDLVFFDLDGTLVDHRSAVWETIGRIVQAAPNAMASRDELVTLWWTLEGRHMRETRTDPERAANVGDMLESDVNAATRAGLTGIWLDRGIDFVTGGPPPPAGESVLRIERLTDLPDHL